MNIVEEATPGTAEAKTARLFPTPVDYSYGPSQVLYCVVLRCTVLQCSTRKDNCDEARCYVDTIHTAESITGFVRLNPNLSNLY